MNELIKQLQEKTGLDVDQIGSVLSGVADFLGDKLPEPIASQITGLLGGDGDAAGAAAGGGEGILDKAKDLLGGDGGGGGLLDQAKGALGGLLGGK